MARQVITTPHPAWFHYSQGIKTEQLIFISGIGGNKNPDTGGEVNGIEAQTRQSLEIIKEILEAGDSSLDDVVSVTVYLKNAGDFFKMNEAYKSYFPEDPPARTTIPTGLLFPSMLVEIQCIACRSSGK